jgi:anti-sigma factor RsiW
MKALNKLVDECTLFSRSMSAYVDGELDAGHAVDMEAHVLRCSACAERVTFLRAMRASLKKRVSTQRAPDALRARVQAAMLAEKRRLKEADREPAGARMMSWKYAAALAAAAGVALTVGATRNRQQEVSMPDVARSGAAEAAAIGFDSLIDDLVALHAHPLPPETTDPDELQRFDPLVGVPVRKPTFQPFGASFNGARVHAMRDRRAALLQYTVQGNHRVTVYVFDPRAVPMQATLLQPRLVHERPVYVGRLRGYSVAAAEKSGVGYAVASDLNDDQSTQLVLSAVQQ